MEDFKTIFLSKTFWGIAVSVAAAVSKQWFHFDVDPALQSQIIDWGLSGIQYLAAGYALYGRVVATKRISMTGS